MITWRVAAQTDPGRQRSRNEDACSVLDHGGSGFTLIVCDGMGGHDDGHIASAVARASLERSLTERFDDPQMSRVLHEALQQAHQEVTAARRTETMGSTAVVARIQGDQIWYGWVGDSRLYILRDGAVLERSEDHTRVAALVAAGSMTADEARVHPDAHMLTQALGSGEVRPTVYAEAVQARPGDVVLLCSDGLHDLVRDDELAGEVAEQRPADAASRLIALANARGGHDNITVVLAFAEGEPASTAAPAPRQHRQTVHDGEPRVAPPPAPPEPAPPSPSAPTSTPIFALLVTAALSAAVGSAITAWWLGGSAPTPGAAAVQAEQPPPPAPPSPSTAPAATPESP